MRLFAIAYACGSLAGLTTGVLIWLLGALGVTGFFGVEIAPQFTPPWLYTRMVWGGLWAGMFLLPILHGLGAWRRAAALSLAPSLVTLFIVLPYKGALVLGMGLGALTPVFVIFFNLSWALVSIAALNRLQGDVSREKFSQQRNKRA